MKTVLSVKIATGHPTDGIDNFNQAIFGRMQGDALTFLVCGEIAERGVIKKIASTPLQFLLSHKVDIMWGTGNVKEFFSVLIGKFLRGSKYAITFHTVLFRKGPWKVRTPWPLRKLMFGFADLVICPSEFSADSVRKYFPRKKVISILNGVDLERFDPAWQDKARLTKKYGIDFSQPIVAFVGSLHQRKRPGFFVDLAKACPAANFVAVGRATPEFDCAAAAQGVANFQWIPSLDREEISIFLASTTIFAFPSLNDAAAAVILEAMASGVVPIVSASGGSGEFFHDGVSGFLVANDDHEKQIFLSAIQKVLSDANVSREMSQAARREAEQHSWSAAAERYEKALSQL